LISTTKSLKKYSVGGVLQEYLSGIRIDKITGSWRYEVLTKGNRRLLMDIRRLAMPIRFGKGVAMVVKLLAKTGALLTGISSSKRTMPGIY
jgi:hypothetical protein